MTFWTNEFVNKNNIFLASPWAYVSEKDDADVESNL